MSLEPSQSHPTRKSNKTPRPIKLDALPISVPKIRSPTDHIAEVRSPIARSSASSKPNSSSSTPARPGSSASGRPGTSVKITEYGVKRANPDPTTFTTDVNLLLEEYLSPRKLVCFWLQTENNNLPLIKKCFLWNKNKSLIFIEFCLFPFVNRKHWLALRIWTRSASWNSKSTQRNVH